MSKQLAIITGGSSGLGLELARCLLQKDVRVCIVGRTQERLDKAQESLLSESVNANVMSYRADVGSELEVQSLFKFFSDGNMTPTILFNIAGVGRFGDPKDISQSMIATVFQGNLVGLILMCSYGLKAMSRDGGVIVNVMSTASLVGRPKESVYCAAKWGARGFTEAFRLATKGSKVKVMAIYPGGMNTPFWNAESTVPSDVDSFMSAQDVAQKIVSAAINVDSSIVSDLTINRIG